jgi:hypothetical protein
VTAAGDPLPVTGTPPAAGASRRDLLVAVLALPVLGLLEPRVAAADAATREAFHYQDHPNSGLHCGQCMFFVAAKSGPGGVCRIIDGEVIASGWCQAYRPA